MPGQELQQLGDVAAGATSWAPQRKLTIDQWRGAGRRLATLDRALQWWLGDWVNYGQRRWGEKYTEAVEITDYDIGTLQSFAWVAGTFEPDRRRPTLSYSHHKEVAALEPAQQELWLDRAEDERWSCLRLRSELRLTQNLEGGSTAPRRSLPRTAASVATREPGPAPRADRLPHRVTFTLQRRAGTRSEVETAAAEVVRSALELGFELAGKPAIR